jgi:hypothetical protein
VDHVVTGLLMFFAGIEEGGEEPPEYQAVCCLFIQNQRKPARTASQRLTGANAARDCAELSLPGKFNCYPLEGLLASGCSTALALP